MHVRSIYSLWTTLPLHVHMLTEHIKGSGVHHSDHQRQDYPNDPSNDVDTGTMLQDQQRVATYIHVKVHVVDVCVCLCVCVYVCMCVHVRACTSVHMCKLNT